MITSLFSRVPQFYGLRIRTPAMVVVSPNTRHYLHHHQQQPQQVRCFSNSSKMKKESIVVIVGATGTGKSKLSIDVATRFSGEVVNSDKIQLYAGLDITTNKLPIPDRRGVPHHLLGDFDPPAGEISPAAFRSLAAASIAGISSRRRVPVVAGGSNSLLQALVAGSSYRCCFLWVEVEEVLLGEYLDMRVDEMVEAGMVSELEKYFMSNNEEEIRRHVGLRKAIGVEEFGKYFGKLLGFEEAVAMVKEKTRRLAEKQVGKIRRTGWEMRRVDATSAVRARVYGEGKMKETEAWERDVAGPAFEAVEEFLRVEEEEEEEEEEEAVVVRDQRRFRREKESLLLSLFAASQLGV